MGLIPAILTVQLLSKGSIRLVKKLSFASVLLIVSIALVSAVSAAAWQSNSVASVEECQALLNNSENIAVQDSCQTPDKNVTWASWFSGKSRSTQFHFLDLFELLFGSSESKKRDYSRPISG